MSLIAQRLADNFDSLMYLLAIVCIITLQWAVERRERDRGGDQ